MRYFAILALLFFSLSVSAQDVANKLANASSRKWIGANVYDGSAADNTTTLTFYTNHKLIVGDRKYNSTKPAQKWWIAEGEYVTDSRIVLKLGSKLYIAEFSKTDKGRDFMTLTRVKENDDDDVIAKTYYAED